MFEIYSYLKAFSASKIISLCFWAIRYICAFPIPAHPAIILEFISSPLIASSPAFKNFQFSPRNNFPNSWPFSMVAFIALNNEWICRWNGACKKPTELSGYLRETTTWIIADECKPIRKCAIYWSNSRFRLVERDKVVVVKVVVLVANTVVSVVVVEVKKT